jgi:hypothetical protein
VLAAVATGELSRRRLDSWRKLHRELAFEQRRRDARAAAEENAVKRRLADPARVLAHEWRRREQLARAARRPRRA